MVSYAHGWLDGQEVRVTVGMTNEVTGVTLAGGRGLDLGHGILTHHRGLFRGRG